MIKMLFICIGLHVDLQQVFRNATMALGLDKLVDDIIVPDEFGVVRFCKSCDNPLKARQAW